MRRNNHFLKNARFETEKEKNATKVVEKKINVNIQLDEVNKIFEQLRMIKQNYNCRNIKSKIEKGFWNAQKKM